MSLSDKAWKHIRERHPEVFRYRGALLEVATKPQLIMKGRHDELKAVKFLDETHLGPMYLVVVFKERGKRKEIITAYFTSNLGKIRGEVVWRA